MGRSNNEREILIDAVPGELRAAVLVGGRLADLVIERENGEGRPGDVFLGRIVRIERGAGGAFVDVGLERPAFLPLAGRRRDRGVVEGAAILVQVTSGAGSEKGARLSTQISLPGRFLVFTPNRGEIGFSHRLRDKKIRTRLRRMMDEIVSTGAKDGGFIVRAAAREADAQDLSAEVRELRAEWRAVEQASGRAHPPALLRREPDPPGRVLRDYAGKSVTRIVIEGLSAFAAARGFCRRFMPEMEGRLQLHAGPAPLFEEREIDAEIDDALSPRVILRSGAALTIEETEALVAIDVDTGALSGRIGGRSAVLESALSAAQEVARQVRLRNLAGLIGIDFPRFEDGRARRRVTERLRTALAEDPRPAHGHGFTAAGLVEVTRQRVEAPLSSQLTEACPACVGGAAGRGRILTPATVAFGCLRALLREAAAAPGARLAVEAAPEVVAYLEEPGRACLSAARRMVARDVSLSANPRFARERFEVTPV